MNWEICLELFELKSFNSFKDEAHSDKAKASIREKCAQYLERAEKLKTFISQKDGSDKKKKPIKDGDSKEWVFL